uniref:MBOAT family protein n=1 Tax=Syphacia muris TaxID=451379 RepID=A0A0N5AAP6_9BILA
MSSTATATNPAKVLFAYPALPKWEIRIYVIIIGLAVIYAWNAVITASNGFIFKFQHRNYIVRNFPLIGPRYKDQVNWEWNRWSSFALSFLVPYLIGHSLIFNIASKYLTALTTSYITLVYSLLSCCYIFTPWLLFLSIVQGTWIFAIASYYRRPLVVWLSALPLLYYVMNWTAYVAFDPFMVLLFVAYTLLSYISYNLEVARGEVDCQNQSWIRRYLRMMFYAFYPPYLISIIVTYLDFEKQMNDREKMKRDWKALIFFAMRVLFWWIVTEYFLYFSYHETILYDLEYAKNLSKDQFVALGMALGWNKLGQFFQLKYVVIFGLPAVFARIDKMQPPKGPICISRVMLYSKIWRFFDRGLYAFFKRYIFIPICQPSFSLKRKLLGIFVSYGFVLLWHGFHYHNIIWILLNIAELFVEYTGKAIYSINAVRETREKYISDVAFRRILGCLQIIPYIFGLYSNFFFLGGETVGKMFVQRIWYEETLTMRYPAIILLLLGYFFAQVIMEVERYLSQPAKLHSA